MGYTLAMTTAVFAALAFDSRLLGAVLFVMIIAGAVAAFLVLAYWRTRDISRGPWLFSVYLAQVVAGMVANTGKEPVGALLLLLSLWIFFWPGRAARSSVP